MVLKAVFFDVDGVLLDTLPAHIQVCVDLAEMETLDLSIPTADEFKNKIIRTGREIAPMRRFFEAVGFEGDALDRAEEWYNDYFSRDYDLPYFDGVKRMLAEMAKTLLLGIVTSNVRKNIEKPLVGSLEHFMPGCVFTEDMGLSKPAALVLGAAYLGLTTEEVLFVGDQKRDREAAETVGAPFLGVTYGWQFKAGDEGLDLVKGPDEILAHIQSKNDC